MTYAPKVVIDTNVYIDALRGSEVALELFRAVRQGRIVPVVSYKLDLEYEDVAGRRPDEIHEDRQEFVDNVMEKKAVLRRDPALTALRTLNDDPKDDFVVALTRSSGAVLITRDGALKNTMLEDVPRIGIFEAVESLRWSGGIQVALPDRQGRPMLLVS